MKQLIVNADDFGLTSSVNKGIIYGFQHGIITSTSLMVNRPYAQEAVFLAKQNPRLGVGLHFEIIGDDHQVIRGLKKVLAYLALGVFQKEKVKKQFLEQIDLFKKMMGKWPTHIDGHYHVHKIPTILPFVKKFSIERKIPFRMGSGTTFIGHFSDHLHPERTSVEYLAKILKELPDGVSELMTHAAYVSDELKKVSSMTDQREAELKVLTSPEIKKIIEQEQIQLISWKDVYNYSRS